MPQSHTCFVVGSDSSCKTLAPIKINRFHKRRLEGTRERQKILECKTYTGHTQKHKKLNLYRRFGVIYIIVLVLVSVVEMCSAYLFITTFCVMCVTQAVKYRILHSGQRAGEQGRLMKLSYRVHLGWKQYTGNIINSSKLLATIIHMVFMFLADGNSLVMEILVKNLS